MPIAELRFQKPQVGMVTCYRARASMPAHSPTSSVRSNCAPTIAAGIARGPGHKLDIEVPHRSMKSMGNRMMSSLISKRSIVVAGHKTSVSLEDDFWNALKELAVARDLTLSELVGTTDADRRHGNLSSAIRLFVLGTYRDQLSRHDRTFGSEEKVRDTAAA